MDSFSGASVVYSTMEPDELDNVSADELAGEDDELSEEDTHGSDAGAGSLCDQFIRARFERWLQDAGLTNEQGELLREIFSRLNVTSRDIEVVSSVRKLHLDFELCGMLGLYRQSSQADVTGPVWDVSKGAFDLKANVEAELVFDGDTLIACAHFAADGLRGPGDSSSLFMTGDGNDDSTTPISGRSRSSIDKDRLGERFGTDTVVNLGGSGVLLQLFGVICADPGASCYAEVLPFGLPAEVLEVCEPAAEHKTASPKKNAQADAGYPSAAADTAPERTPAAVAAVKPTKPSASNSGPPRPVGTRRPQPASPRAKESTPAAAVPKGSSAAPKAKQSSQGRKPAAAPR